MGKSSKNRAADSQVRPRETKTKKKKSAADNNDNNNAAKWAKVTITAHASARSPHSSPLNRSRRIQSGSDREGTPNSRVEEDSQSRMSSQERGGSRRSSHSRSKSRSKSRSRSVKEGMLTSSSQSNHEESDSEAESRSSRNVSFQEMQQQLEKSMEEKLQRMISQGMEKIMEKVQEVQTSAANTTAGEQVQQVHASVLTSDEAVEHSSQAGVSTENSGPEQNNSKSGDLSKGMDSSFESDPELIELVSLRKTLEAKIQLKLQQSGSSTG